MLTTAALRAISIDSSTAQPHFAYAAIIGRSTTYNQLNVFLRAQPRWAGRAPVPPRVARRRPRVRLLRRELVAQSALGGDMVREGAGSDSVGSCRREPTCQSRPSVGEDSGRAFAAKHRRDRTSLGGCGVLGGIGGAARCLVLRSRGCGACWAVYGIAARWPSSASREAETYLIFGILYK